MMTRNLWPELNETSYSGETEFWFLEYYILSKLVCMCQLLYYMLPSCTYDIFFCKMI